MRWLFESLSASVLIFGVVSSLSAQDGRQEQAPAAAKPGPGSFVIGDKTYKLEHVVAYETKLDDATLITVLASDRRISADKIKAALREGGGSDERLSLDQPHVKIVFDKAGEAIQCLGSADGRSFAGGDLTGELKIAGGRVRGQAKMTRKDERVFKLSFELRFDVELGAESAPKPAVKRAGPVKPTVSGTFKVHGTSAKLAYVSAHAREPFAGQSAIQLVFTEQDHSKNKEPGLMAGFREFGNALIISLHEDGKIFGCEVAHSKKTFSAVGRIKTDAFDLGDGQISGRITTDGEAEVFDKTWEVDIKFAAPFTATAPPTKPVAADKPSSNKSGAKPKVEKPRSKPDPQPLLNVSDLPIPKDATNIEFKKLVEQIVFKSPAGVTALANALSKQFDEQKWSKVGGDLVTPKSAILNRKKGDATLTIFVKPADRGSAVTIMSQGLSWEAKPTQTKASPADDAAAPTRGIRASQFPVPDKAKEVERNADFEMITCRSSLSAKEVAEFYRKKIAALGWKENKEDALLLEEDEVGALTFEKGDDSFRILIQPGKPTSRTRIVVEGKGLLWDAKDAGGDADSLKPKADNE